MELQHVNVKIYASTPEAVSLEEAILIFHRWIQNDLVEEMLIDVADYQHVPAGPGVLLIGHEGAYSLDLGPESRPGLLYNVKIKRDGDNVERLSHALRQALKACALLEQDELWAGKVSFNAGDARILVNDRGVLENTPEAFAAVKGDLESALKNFYGDRAFALNYEQGDPRQRFQVTVSTDVPVSVKDLAAAV